MVVLAAMVIALLALLTFAPTSSTGPAEDCAAVRARDHQIYLNLIASLPPAAPVPPEYINPCLTAPSTTVTAAPTTTVGLPGRRLRAVVRMSARTLRRTSPPTTAPRSSRFRRSRFHPLLPSRRPRKTVPAHPLTRRRRRSHHPHPHSTPPRVRDPPQTAAPDPSQQRHRMVFPDSLNRLRRSRPPASTTITDATATSNSHWSVPQVSPPPVSEYAGGPDRSVRVRAGRSPRYRKRRRAVSDRVESSARGTRN